MFSSVQSLSRVQLFATPWITACQASLSITNSRSSLRLMSMESMRPSSHLILCRPLLLPPIPPSIRVFSNESTLHMRWPKHWSFSFSISPSKEHPGLISFRMDWLDLLAVQGTRKSLLQHHSSKASILRHSAFFTVQLSHPYMTTGKTIALTRRTFVGKVMSLLLNMLPRLVMTFLPRSKRLLISWLQSPSAVILEPQKIKSDTVAWTILQSFFCLAVYNKHIWLFIVQDLWKANASNPGSTKWYWCVLSRLGSPACLPDPLSLPSFLPQEADLLLCSLPPAFWLGLTVGTTSQRQEAGQHRVIFNPSGFVFGL